jgi:hypothetical protein
MGELQVSRLRKKGEMITQTSSAAFASYEVCIVVDEIRQ